ncbi:MAG TPA: DUF58 domain-containing protein [Candidatus Binatia bacterium]|nr:DUF58 domain-containing protein [Candidatus Binatia bacterium]
MTRWGAIFLLAALVPLAASSAYPGLLIPGVAVAAAAALVVLVDSRRAPGSSRLRVSREHDQILSAGRANAISVRIELQPPAGRLAAMVRDEHPPHLAASGAVQRISIPGVLRYTVTPEGRGEERFGATVVRCPGPWRLGLRQSAVGDGETLRVDADLAAVSSYQALARRGQLAELGVRAQRRPGEGTEFERVRDAVPDDPERFINWKATARTGRLMATELIPERAQPVVICLDHGRLMGVGAGALTKLDHAINAALLLIHVALTSGDRVGLFAFADRVTATLPPRSGRLQMRRFLDAVRPLRAGEVEADYDEALTELSRWQRRRALLAIFTDVLDPDQGAALVRQCTRLSRRHLPLVVTVRDPALEDAARARPLEVRATYARAVAGSLVADREQTLELLRRGGVEILDADARTLSPRLVNRYLELKRRSRL